jgi:hypothetical protein
MGLINIVTNLSDFYYYQAKGYVGGRGNFSAKKLPYGNDRAHGGSSKQPYIQTPIPENSGGFGVLDTDFILRGGSRAVTDSIKDVERLGKYFLDIRNPSGLLFVAKQNLLSRTAVRTQASGFLLNEGAYTPISTLLQAGGVAFGLHVNKQGLNPFDGLGSIGKYEDNVQRGSNRLEALYGTKIFLDDSISYAVIGSTINSSIVNVLSYKGGPGSILGIGNTNIKFADQRTSWGTDKKLGSQVTQNDTLVLTPSQIADASELNKYRNTSAFTPQIQDFRKILRGPNGLAILNSTVISNSPDYNGPEAKNIESRVNLGDPGNRAGKNLTSYVNGNFNGAASEDSYDKITALAIYESGQNKEVQTNINSITNDLVQFRIEVINNEENGKNTFIHFRAFLDNISDSYDANWIATQYIGRGEKFYTYGGFDRKVSLGWTVAAQSKAELIPMYKKLNYLASTLAPDYSSVGGFMRGNLVKLTVGGYFFEQPGIITSLSYEIKEDSPWEIGIPDVTGASPFVDPDVKELPHIIRVSGFNFIPIHTFAPSIQKNTYGDITANINNPYIDTTNYGPQRYISLKTAADSNYDKNQASLASIPTTSIVASNE